MPTARAHVILFTMDGGGGNIPSACVGGYHIKEHHAGSCRSLVRTALCANGAGLNLIDQAGARAVPARFGVNGIASFLHS